MNELGDYLKRMRVNNGVSLAEAAEDLNLTTDDLENIESGNVKAFKDVYDLKGKIEQYSKYLGLDSEKVIDEFNGFLFEHTSKISIEDIRMAKEKMEEAEKKIQSPYTMEYKEKVNYWPIVMGGLVLILLSFLLYLILTVLNKAPERSDELKKNNEVTYYELT